MHSSGLLLFKYLKKVIKVSVTIYKNKAGTIFNVDDQNCIHIRNADIITSRMAPLAALCDDLVIKQHERWCIYFPRL